MAIKRTPVENRNEANTYRLKFTIMPRSRLNGAPGSKLTFIVGGRLELCRIRDIYRGHRDGVPSWRR